MKIPYYTVLLNFDEDSGSLFLEGSGISIEFKISNEEREQILNFLEDAKKIEDILLTPIPINVTKRLLENEVIDRVDVNSLNHFWETVNYVFLGPYRVLLKHAGETEKQRKALRDFFKPIRFRLRSIQTVMEAENKVELNKDALDIII
jgi:hypothetical protein